VVNYEVKVELLSLEAVAQERQAARQEATQNLQPGELPERLRQAVEEGRMTQEEAEERMSQRQQGGGLPGGRPGGQQGQTLTRIPADFQLREGLTVTVSLIVEERNNVLLVPNKAITRQGGETIVKVMNGDVIEERSIRTGISDFQNTEVIEGLSEGEQVVVPQGTAASAPSTPQRGGPPVRIPGVGRIR
jgi:hypothetical protein